MTSQPVLPLPNNSSEPPAQPSTSSAEYQMSTEWYPQQQIQQKEYVPKTTSADLLFALALLIGGFYFWHYLNIGFFGGYGIGVTLFFLYTIAISFVYLSVKGIAQNLKSWLLLTMSVLGALPFVLYGARDINVFLVSFEAVLCLFWIMYSCRTEISKKLNLNIIGDFLNQLLIVPFANFGRFFTHNLRGLKGKKSAWRPILFATIGLCISLPIFLVVIGLLALSDDGFSNLVENVFSLYFEDVKIIRYLFELLFAFPLAAYLFGAVFGNLTKRNVDTLKEQDLLGGFTHVHSIPKAVVYTPLFLFIALYILYFIAVGSYLFSGLQGQLPVVYTYAEYARRGFFELCAIAAINLFVIGTIWLFAKRQDKEYPPLLRILAGALSLLTCLLIITALSKMYIYIQAYGLTTLRVYTTWFMLFMLLMFCLIVVWHIKTFNAARPIIVLVLAFSLGLGLTNTNSFIANYNVDRYISGATERIDIKQLEQLGYSAAPALYKLRQNTEDSLVKDSAAQALAVISNPYERTVLFEAGDWSSWNREKSKAHALYEK